MSYNGAHSPAGSRLLSDYLAPRDPLEWSVCKAFETALEVDRVGWDASLAEIGVTPGALRKAAALVATEFGVSVDTEMLQMCTTVEQVARAFRDGLGGAVPYPRALVLQEGEGRPLICFPPLSGVSIAYVRLAKLLGPQHRLIGMQSPGSNPGETPLETIEEMAGLFAESLAESGLRGPHRFCGWSMGGQIAYELALRLTEAGEQVELLALLDADPPGMSQVAPHKVDDVTRSHPNAADMITDRAHFESLPPEGQIEYVLERAIASGIAPPGRSGTTAALRLAVRQANLKAYAGYAPSSRQLACSTALLFLTKEAVADVPEYRPDGWRPRFVDPPIIEWVPGNHHGALREPTVSGIAGVLKRHLKQ